MNFGTSNVTALVTALVYVMQGVLSFAAFTFILLFLSCLVLILVDVAVFREADPSCLFTTKLFTSKLPKVLIGTFFGCWGGVVSLLAVARL